MATVQDRYLPMDEEGYFVFEHGRVDDAQIGRPLIENIISPDGQRFATSMDGQQVWLEPFNAPLVARHVKGADATHGLMQLPYGAQAHFEYSKLSLDEWDRFHGVTDKGIPFVLSRNAQVEFFDLLEEFDDESITVKGQRFDIPQWLNPKPFVNNDTYWSDRYRSKDTGWELGRESVVLPTVLPQLKLNRCRVLVLGCGSGKDAAYFAQMGHVVTAVDFSSEAIQLAKAEYSGLENLKLVQADAFNLPREWNERFDLIFEHTLYCAINPERRNDLVKVWSQALTPMGNLLGVFYTMEKRTEPPFGGSEWEVKERLKSHFDFMFWTRWRHSIEARKSKELVVFGRKKVPRT